MALSFEMIEDNPWDGQPNWKYDVSMPDLWKILMRLWEWNILNSSRTEMIH